jgi:hypothetical protein
MRVWIRGLMGALGLALVGAPGVSWACTQCHHTPCVMVAPQPAYQCVTEMVPYTVNRVVTRTHWQTVTETVMVREANTTYVECQRTVCRPVYDTKYIPKTITVCRAVSETTKVSQCVPVCRPVTTTQQVTEYCLQPTTQQVTVAAAPHGCGRCGKVAPACGCVTVTQTCYTQVPVVRNVQVTQYVTEMKTREVPVTTTRFVPETKTVNVPLVSCRMVSEVVTDKIPVTTFRCVPKTVTRKIPYPVCENVTETCYRPVTRMVPVVPAAAPQAAPTSQSAPSSQS